MKNVILLGSSGFIGRYLSEEYNRDAAAKCIPLSTAECNLLDRAAVELLSQQFSPTTTLLMCAGIKRQYGDSFEIFEKNLAMTLNLCVALERRPVGKIVFLSSAAVYGEDVENLQISETTPVNPRTLYGLGKHTSEQLFAKLNIPLLIVRPPLVYGSGDSSRGYGPAGMLEQLRHNADVPLWGDGSEQREFFYVRDLCRLIMDLAAADCTGVVNAASGTSRSYADCLRILRKVTGSSSGVHERARSKPKVDHRFDPSRIRRMLPAFRFTTLEQGLEEMVLAEVARSASESR